MNLIHYFRSLSLELSALKGRVRHLINDQHWPTDGEWKESVLRTVIRRSAPSSVSIGRGFVVAHDGCSSQIDILIYDNSHPVLYRDGDLVFISPAACRAIIEVKSKITSSNIDDAVKKLSIASNFIRRRTIASEVFVGLFAYELDSLSPDRIMNSIAAVADSDYRKVIDHLALGESSFIKFWGLSPTNPKRDYQHWHFYKLDQMAMGYFIHNLLLHLAPYREADLKDQWFPEDSKELHLLHSCALHDA